MASQSAPMSSTLVPSRRTLGAFECPAQERRRRPSRESSASTAFTANADATVIAGAASLDCVLAEDGCTLLPLTFPVQVSQCDASGELIEGPWIGAPPPDPENVGDEYWPIVGAGDLPSPADPDGNPDTMALLPLCRALRAALARLDGWTWTPARTSRRRSRAR